MSVRKLRSKNYKAIIEVNAPVRFYWTWTGFDGIEIGPLGRLSRNQEKLLKQVLEAVGSRMKQPDEVPEAFLDAFDG